MLDLSQNPLPSLKLRPMWLEIAWLELGRMGLDPLELGPLGIGTLGIVALGIGVLAPAAPTQAATYYVSSSSGADSHDGLTPATPFATAARVNALSLLPGDEVRFFCGEVWRGDPLQITHSGTAAQPIIVSSFPSACADKPVFSGARGITGWLSAGQNLFVSDLDEGTNAGLFPMGIGHLFRDGERLPLGRWPNLQGHPDGGYAEVDSSPSALEITDAELPPTDWTGAVLRIKGIRWYLQNRNVVADTGSTLAVDAPLSCFQESCHCFSGDCSQWGYHLTQHPATLDLEGEWYFDSVTNQVFLYSTGPAPDDGEIEAAVVLPSEGIFHGAVTLGRHLFEHVAWVIVENLRIERWFGNGITFPENLQTDQNHHLTLRNNQILDVDDVGLRLTTWVWQPAAGTGPVGWRGGRNLLIEGNEIDGANNRGILAYSVNSDFLGNSIENIALIPNLGREGMGCGFTTTQECTENGDGLSLPWAPVAPDHTAHNNRVQRNHLRAIGMNGIDCYGRDHLIENNIVDRACQSKSDCGGIRVYGNGDLTTTPTHDVVLRGNIVRDTLGNADGVHPYFDNLFGFGIYLDNWVRGIQVQDNTVTGATWVGLIFRLASGSATGNTLYDNVAADYGTELSLIDSSSVQVTDNVLFPLGFLQETMRVSELSSLGVSNRNHFFAPYDETSIWDETLAGDPELDDRLTLNEWQAHSGGDGLSSIHWYTQDPTEPPRSEIFVNDTEGALTFPLVGTYFDLHQTPVIGDLLLQPFSSQILIRQAELIFLDGFESGNTNAWSARVP